MKRIKKIKITRTKKQEPEIKIEDRKPITDKLGGFLPYPPSDCKAPRFRTSRDNIKWVDRAFCTTKCAEKRCDRYHEINNDEYKKLKEKQRREKIRREKKRNKK